MGRITVQDAVSALLDLRLTKPGHVRTGTDDTITSVAEDQLAGMGAAAWLSAAAVAGGSERVSAFRGSFLIVPEAAFASAAAFAPAPVTVVASDRPKLAMIRLLEALVGTAPSDAWPDDADVRMGSNVRVAPGVVFGAGVTLGDDVVIGPNCCIAHATIGSGVAIGANCTIGLAGFGFERDEDGTLVRFPHVGDVVIEDDVEVGSNTCIDRGALGSTVLRKGCKIDNLVHIAHNVVLGERSLVIAHAMVGGGAVIGADAWVAPSAAIMNKAVIGEGSVVGLGAVVLKGTEPGQTVVGNPARPLEKAKGTDVTPG